MRAVKKPIPVDFVQFTRDIESIKKLKEFMGKNMGCLAGGFNGLPLELEIVTLEDGEVLEAKHIAREGDYIVKGAAGEFWPVRKEIFELTYEVIDEK